MTGEKNNATAVKVTLLGMWLNILLALVKVTAGILGMSIAVVADGIHSISDSISDVVALTGLKISRKPRDESHHYGHGKFETLASVLIGLMILSAGAGMAFTAVDKLRSIAGGDEMHSPRTAVLIVVVLSVIVKEWMYRYTISRGKKIKSSILVANAWHHRTDAFSSVAVLIGLGAMFLLGKGYYILDPLSALLVSLLVVWVSWKIVLNAMNELLEKALPPDRIRLIKDTVMSVDGVIETHKLRTRSIGNTVAVDLHILVNSSLGIVQAHDIASMVEKRLREVFGPDTIINVHAEPYLECIRPKGTQGT